MAPISRASHHYPCRLHKPARGFASMLSVGIKLAEYDGNIHSLTQASGESLAWRAARL